MLQHTQIGIAENLLVLPTFAFCGNLASGTLFSTAVWYLQVKLLYATFDFRCNLGSTIRWEVARAE